MKIQMEFKKEDCWIGGYWRQDKDTLHIWICVLPCLPLHILIPHSTPAETSAPPQRGADHQTLNSLLESLPPTAIVTVIKEFSEKVKRTTSGSMGKAEALQYIDGTSHQHYEAWRYGDEIMVQGSRHFDWSCQPAFTVESTDNWG